jgi:hypothetical protein
MYTYSDAFFACNGRLDVLTKVVLKIYFFWGVMLCRWVNSFQCLEGSWFLHFECQTVHVAFIPTRNKQQKGEYRPIT